MRGMKRSTVLTIVPFLSLLAALAAAQDPPAVTYVDGEGHRDCLLDGKPVWRHMNAYDPARLAETYKTFHHVFAQDGKRFITKGAGGRYTHHRGLYLGWSKVKTGTSGGDFWHCKGVTIRLKEYTDDATSVNEWIDKAGEAVARDTKKVTTSRLDDGSLVMDFDIEVEALDGKLDLNGDPQHAGFQFRAHDGVNSGEGGTRKHCEYLRPASAKSKGGDVWTECPWVVGTFDHAGTDYSVQHMNHPSNPKFDETVYSTRNYGRFGAYAPHAVEAGGKLALKYRVVVSTETPDAATAQARYDAWSK